MQMPLILEVQTDEYWVRLTRTPTGTVHVDVEVDDQIRIVAVDTMTFDAAMVTLTFTTADWNVPQMIVVKAVDDSDKEATHYSRITHEIHAADLDYFLGITDEIVAKGIAAGINGDIDNDFDAQASSDQVTITGPAFNAALVTPYTDATLTLGGDPLEGEGWTLRVNGTAYVHTVALGEGLTAVAAALQTLVSAGEPDLTVTATGTSGIHILGGTEVFTVTFAVSGASNGHATLTAATPVDFVEDAASERAWLTASIELLDSPPAPVGAVWTVALKLWVRKIHR